MFRSGSSPVGRAMLYIALAATAWGTGGAVAALLSSGSGLNSLTVSFWRFCGGAAALGLALPVRHARRSGPSRAQPHQVHRPLIHQLRAAPVRLALTGLGMAVSQTAYFAAVVSAGLAVATMVTIGAAPVLVALAARRWLGEPLGPRRALAIAAALTGLALLVLGGEQTGAAAPAPLLGIALALLSAVAYAATTLLTRVMSTGENGDSVTTILIAFALGALCLLPLAAAGGLLPAHGDVATAVALLVYLALFPSALAYGMFFTALKQVTATTASIIVLMEPLTATAIAVVLLGEHLTVAAALGGAVLLASVMILAFLERPKTGWPETGRPRRLGRWAGRLQRW